MSVTQIDIANPRQRRQFLNLPFQIYRDIPQWVPPLEMDAQRVLNPRQHPFYRHSEAAFFLATDGQGRSLGRIAVLNNRRYNEYRKQRSAFFYLFECADDRETSQSLFEAAFDWARRQGLRHIWGPKGFTALDGLGLLSQGFEHRPALGIPYNPPYYVDMVTAAGFSLRRELLSGHLDRNAQFPDRIHELARRVRERRGLSIATFRTRSELRALVPKIQYLYNGTLTATSGNPPLTDDEMRTMANQLIWFADPKLIKVVVKDDDPVGFVLAYPDISAAIQRTRGRLWPLGWADLLLEFRRTKWVNLNGAGIVEKYRGLGGTAILFSEMAKSLIEGDFEHADFVQIGTENDKMLREAESLGLDFYKTHRVYERAL